MPSPALKSWVLTRHGVCSNNLGGGKLFVLILRPSGIKVFYISLVLQKEECVNGDSE